MLYSKVIFKNNIGPDDNFKQGMDSVDHKRLFTSSTCCVIIFKENIKGCSILKVLVGEIK